jgi:hypothetical protein
MEVALGERNFDPMFLEQPSMRNQHLGLDISDARFRVGIPD